MKIILSRYFSKEADGVIPPSDLTRKRLLDDGFVFHQGDPSGGRGENLPTQKVLSSSGLKIKQIQALNLENFSNGLQIPYLFLIDPFKEIKIEGDNLRYYLVDADGMKRKKRYFRLLVIENNSVSKPAYIIKINADENPNFLEALDETEKRVNQMDQEKIQKAVNSYNRRIKRWANRTLHITNIPFLLNGVEKRINLRLNVLKKMHLQLERKAEHFEKLIQSGPLAEYKQEMSLALESSNLTDEDIRDTVLYLNNSQLQKLLEDIKAGKYANIEKNPVLKSDLITFIENEREQRYGTYDSNQEYYRGRYQREQGEEESTQVDIYDSLRPIEETGEKPGRSGYSSQLKKYMNISNLLSSAIEAKNNIQRDIDRIDRVLSYVSDLRRSILNKKENEGLTNESISEDKQFISMVKEANKYIVGIIDSYKDPIFNSEGKLNPRLWGNKGSVGNLTILPEINLTYMATKKILDEVS